MILYVCKVQTQAKLSMLFRDTYLCINTIKEKNNIHQKTEIPIRLPVGGKESDATGQHRSLDDVLFLKLGSSHVVVCLIIILKTSHL